MQNTASPNQTYGTPPKLEQQVSPEQRAAIEGEVKSSIRGFSSGIALTVTGLAGAAGGALWGLLSTGKSFLWQRIVGGAIGTAVIGYFINNLTWQARPSTSIATAARLEDAGIAPEQTTPASQVAKLEEQRNAPAADTSIQR